MLANSSSPTRLGAWEGQGIKDKLAELKKSKKKKGTRTLANSSSSTRLGAALVANGKAVASTPRAPGVSFSALRLTDVVP